MGLHTTSLQVLRRLIDNVTNGKRNKKDRWGSAKPPPANKLPFVTSRLRLL